MSRKKQIRAAFRLAVFARDRFQCVMCGIRGKDRQGGYEHKKYHPDISDEQLVLLDAHHITDRNELPNGGYVIDNGITLCDTKCHALAEIFHQTGTSYPGYSPAELYMKIHSSFQRAYDSSSELT